MEWTFRKAAHLKINDLGCVYDKIGKNLGTALRSVSHRHDNCSINDEDFANAYRLKMESVLFQNKQDQQVFVSFEKAIEFFKKGEKRYSPEGSYTVISWATITEQNEFPDDDLPF